VAWCRAKYGHCPQKAGVERVAINFGQPAEQWLDKPDPSTLMQAIGGRTGT